MGCHPNPIDELHHFSEGWLNQQPAMGNGPEIDGLPINSMVDLSMAMLVITK